jgi:CBS domain-containing protein
MKAEDVMTTKVITVTEDQTKQQAARLLSRHRISGLLVVNAANVVIGVVTEYDVISKEGQTVAEIMTRGVISIAPDTDLEDVSHMFVQERIKRLPVLHQGRLVGIISRADLVREVALHWICPVCGEVIRSEYAPQHCPRCGASNMPVSSEPVSPGS